MNPTYIHSEVMLAEGAIDIGLSSNAGTIVVRVDRATASRLINQLRRALDTSYNDAINERPLSDPHPEPPSYPIPNY